MNARQIIDSTLCENGWVSLGGGLEILTAPAGANLTLFVPERVLRGARDMSATAEDIAKSKIDLDIWSFVGSSKVCGTLHSDACGWNVYFERDSRTVPPIEKQVAENKLLGGADAFHEYDVSKVKVGDRIVFEYEPGDMDFATVTSIDDNVLVCDDGSNKSNEPSHVDRDAVSYIIRWKTADGKILNNKRQVVDGPPQPTLGDHIRERERQGVAE